MTFWDEFYPILCPIALLKKIISNTALKLHTKKWAFKHFGMFWLKGKNIFTIVGRSTTLQEALKVKTKELHG